MILNNGESLAYLGDSVYEVLVRNYLLKKGITDVNRLHKEAILYTSGEAQAKIIDKMINDNILSEEEIYYYKRGRNSNHSQNGRKIKLHDYIKATGFEALIGYLYLESKFERIEELFTFVKNYVEEGL